VYVLTSSLIGYFLGLLIQQQEQLPTEVQTIKQSTSVSICDEVVAQVNTKVEDIYTEEIAPVKFDSFPDARMYRTTITEQVKKGPDLAGHYKVVTWGCGTECQGYAIVDVITGNIVAYEP